MIAFCAEVLVMRSLFGSVDPMWDRISREASSSDSCDLQTSAVALAGVRQDFLHALCTRPIVLLFVEAVSSVEPHCTPGWASA